MSLHDLMKKYGSDKADHGFCEFYESFFGPVREEVKSVLEIGVADGASIRGWLDYFPNAIVDGVDAPPDAAGKYGGRMYWPSHKRFRAFIADQADRAHLAELLQFGPWDIIIDDGGHTMEQQQVSLGVLFPHTRMFYVVEDLYTSFGDEIVISGPYGVLATYPTGAFDEANTVTYSLLRHQTWHDSSYLTRPEADFLDGETHEDAIHIFDRDDDHKHMTAVLEVKE